MDIQQQLDKLLTEQAQVLGEARTLVEGADEERGLSAEQTQELERRNERLDEIDSQVKGLEQIVTRGAALQESRERLGALGKPVTKEEGPSLSDRFRQLALGEIRDINIELPSNYSARDMTSNTVKVGDGTGSSAGVLTQKEFVQQFLSTLTETSSLLSLGPRVLNTTNGNLIEMPRQIGRTALVSRVAEGATIPKVAGPTFDRVTLAARKYAGISQITYEMVRDGIIDLSPLLATELGESAALAVNADLYTGDGNNKPYGLLTRVTTGVTGSGVAGPTFDNLIDLEHSLAQKYRARAAFILNDDTFRLLRHVKDTTGNFIYQPGTRDGAPATILGRRFVTDEHIPTVGASAKSVLLGDVSAYWYRQVNGVRIERSTEYEWENDVISYKAVIYAGGDLFDLNAIKAFASAAS